MKRIIFFDIEASSKAFTKDAFEIKEDLIWCICCNILGSKESKVFVRRDFKTEIDMVDDFFKYLMSEETIIVGFNASATLSIVNKSYPFDLRLLFSRTTLIKDQHVVYKSLSPPTCIWYYPRIKTQECDIIPIDVYDIVCTRYRSDMIHLMKDGIGLNSWLARFNIGIRKYYDLSSDPCHDIDKLMLKYDSKISDAVIKYCINDLECTKQLFLYLGGLDLGLFLVDAVKSIGGNVKIDDVMLGGATLKLTHIMDSIKLGNKYKFKLDFVGGLVKEPIIGLYKNIWYLDIVNFYPNIAIKYNISPELFSKDGTNKLYYYTVKFKQMFYNLLTKVGWFPKLLEKILTKIDSFSLDSDGYKKKELKQLANSFIGVFSSERFKYYNPLVTAIIISQGRDIMKKFDLSFKSIGGDTDSRFIFDKTGVEEFFKNIGFKVKLVKLDILFISKKKTYISVIDGKLDIKSLRKSDITDEGITLIYNIVKEILNISTDYQSINNNLDIFIESFNQSKYSSISLVFKRLTLKGIEYFVIDEDQSSVVKEIIVDVTKKWKYKFSKTHIDKFLRKIITLFRTVK